MTLYFRLILHWIRLLFDYFNISDYSIGIENFLIIDPEVFLYEETF
jgi:hypothetical protein